MVNSILHRNKDELCEFYEWLLYRAQEKESKGNKDQGHFYKEYAELIKEKIDCPRCDAGDKSSAMMRSAWSGIGFNKLIERLIGTHASLKQSVSNQMEAQ